MRLRDKQLNHLVKRITHQSLLNFQFCIFVSSTDALTRCPYLPRPPSVVVSSFVSMHGAIYDNICEVVGKTPVVRLNRIPKDGWAEILVKLESFNPGGSVKDRIGLSMVEAAERSGRLKPGGTIVEPTIGNTGIGLAMVAAAKGYKVILT